MKLSMKAEISYMSDLADWIIVFFQTEMGNVFGIWQLIYIKRGQFKIKIAAEISQC